MTDQELVEQYRSSGDMNTLAILYQRYVDLLYGVCLRYLEDRELAKDAVMNIFEELVVKLKKHEVEYVKSWLYTLAKNHCLMQLRSPKNLKTNSFEPDGMQFAEYPHLNGDNGLEENLDRLTGCMDKLPEEQRASVQMFYLQQKGYKEIAEITGMDWNRVRSQIQNGRRNLKICMEKNSNGMVNSESVPKRNNNSQNIDTGHK